MNFQAVQPNGGYVKMMAQIVSANPIRQGKFGPEADILLCDQANTKAVVTISPGKYNNPIPTVENHGQTGEFSVKVAQTQQGPKYYGFWNVRQQQAPQTPPQAAQGTNAPPAQDDRQIRQWCFQEALATLRAGKLKSEQSIYEEATDYYNWLMFSRTPGQSFANDNDIPY